MRKAISGYNVHEVHITFKEAVKMDPVSVLEDMQDPSHAESIKVDLICGDCFITLRRYSDGSVNGWWTSGLLSTDLKQENAEAIYDDHKLAYKLGFR